MKYLVVIDREFPFIAPEKDFLDASKIILEFTFMGGVRSEPKPRKKWFMATGFLAFIEATTKSTTEK